MDGEDKKVGLKKRAKQTVINLDSDDDEPIGSLFKLKSKRNPKKVKLGPNGEKGKKLDVKLETDEGLGGMEDTLASFRKKLKAPKKDSGSGNLVKTELPSKLDESPDGCLDVTQKVEGSIIELVPEHEGEVGCVSSDANRIRKPEKKRSKKVKSYKSVIAEDVRTAGGNSCENQVKLQEGLLGSQNKLKKKTRRSKSTSARNTLRASIAMDDGKLPGDCALGGQVEGKEVLASISDDVLGDSLSSFLRKAQKTQSGLHKKLRVPSCSKSRREVQASKNDCSPDRKSVV